tara:strand:+ start:2332 stop:4002 length:1671 start_codon:yes stop_codon:yes gene_type:complete
MQLRLFSGLILFIFVLTHLLNHMAGLHSVAWMNDGLVAFELVWRSLPGTVLLYGSLLVHLVLAVVTLWRRDNLTMNWRDGLQIGLGLLVPLLVAGHVAGTRLAWEFYDTVSSYDLVLLYNWITNPVAGIQLAVLVVAVWLHGVMGLRHWLRLKPWFREASPLLFAASILVPVLGLLGFVQGGRAVEAFATDPDWTLQLYTRANLLETRNDVVAMVNAAQPAVLTALSVVLVLIALGRPLRTALARKRLPVRISYPHGHHVDIQRGVSVLEASRRGRIPHASVCGGRGRCSTCRIRVGTGLNALQPPHSDESRVLERIKAPDDVRLACMLRPTADITVTPLLAPTGSGDRVLSSHLPRGGEEREIAVLFADLRGFTSLSEEQLPYDTVFVLNRYFAAMGAAIEEAGGHVDKFIGDGVMAIFGLQGDFELAKQQSLVSAANMARALDRLNESLADDLPQPLRMGIGIHAGAAVVGEMGYGSTLGMTAVGDVVNTASRLEASTKEFGAQLVVSEAVLGNTKAEDPCSERHEISIRGRRGMLAVRAYAAATDVIRQTATG